MGYEQLEIVSGLSLSVSVTTKSVSVAAESVSTFCEG